jgi:hypothetical protein
MPQELFTELLRIQFFPRRTLESWNVLEEQQQLRRVFKRPLTVYTQRRKPQTPNHSFLSSRNSPPCWDVDDPAIRGSPQPVELNSLQF